MSLWNISGFLCRVRAIIAPPVALYRLVHAFSLPVRAGSAHSGQQLEQSLNSDQKTARAQFFSIGNLIRNGHGVYGSFVSYPLRMAYSIYGSWYMHVANLVGVVRLEVGVTSLSCNGLGFVVLQILEWEGLQKCMHIHDYKIILYDQLLYVRSYEKRV